MRVLLDTCAFIWIDGSERDRFGAKAAALLNAPGTTYYLSHTSIWEIATKRAVGKLPARTPLKDSVRRHLALPDFQLLEWRLEHSLMVEELPLHHRDPFDRLLIAQALVEDLPVLSSDESFDLYGVRRIWE